MADRTPEPAANVTADAPGGSLKDLQQVLGHTFAEPALLDRALQHSSLAGELGKLAVNERLEFLGDRVLGLVIAEMLLDRFPAEREGEIAYRHTALVRKEALARVAKTLELGGHIRMAAGEEQRGGRQNQAILANACEAVIAAIYRDAGLEAAQTFIARHWEAMFGETLSPPKDFKTSLQEWAQGRGLGLPQYHEVSRDGPDHAPTFTVEVDIKGHGTARAIGPSKRAAEQQAAQAMLENALGEKSTDALDDAVND